VPAKPDYLSTLGIDYLMESLRQLVQDYNDFAGVDDGEAIERISPKVLGVVFTMVQFNRKQPISALRTIIAQTKKLNVPVFDSLVRENKTVFAEAPLTGLPVVLQAYSSDTHQRVVKELRELVTEFERRLS
jgi:chromosome partitioning protein